MPTSELQQRRWKLDQATKNVPFTVEFANISTTDIVGIKGQLSVPTYFHSPQGTNYPILADSNAKATTGSNFSSYILCRHI